MLIVASKLFQHENVDVIHMPTPCGESINELFVQNPSLECVVLTDCIANLFEDDLKDIENTKTLRTKIPGVFCVTRDTKLHSCASTWTEVLNLCAPPQSLEQQQDSSSSNHQEDQTA